MADKADDRPSQGRISRRRFLKIAGITAGTVVLAGSGLVVLGTRTPGSVQFVEDTFGQEGGMKDKVLVAYASRCGSTGGVAQAIAEQLAKSGAMVDVRLVKDVTDLSAYKAVVVGSCIRMGQWVPEAVKLVTAQKEALSQVPVAYFAVSGFMRDGKEETRAKVSAGLDPVRALREPASVGLFAGAIDSTKMSFLDRTMTRMMKSEEGDWRDWDAIRAWAGEARKALGL
jgi:menaquinone-dependent protoporphyrinogen oxidase